MSEAGISSPFCPRFQRGMEVIGRRWTGAIVRALMTGSRRFNEIADTVPGISDRLLSERLKELEAEDIVERRVVPSTPVRVDYQLTAKGRALMPVFEALAGWVERWVALPAAAE
jgi:DNA-binding HxlR family transcriptional regulator